MRLKEQLVIGISLVLLLSTLSSAITVRSQKVKRKSTENVKFLNDEGEISTSSEKLSERQGFHEDDEETDLFLESTLDSKELVKKAQNVSEAKPIERKKKKVKEHSPPTVEVLGTEENSDEDGERLAKSDREADKNPRIYYDDASPRFPASHPHHSSGDESPFERSTPEGKQKNGKLYFPKNYISGKLTSTPKRGHKPSLVGLSGKRIPDHVHFDENGHPGNHEYSSGLGHSHQHPVIGHHEEHSIDLGPADEAPYSHGIEEHHGKEYHGHGGHHVSGYGYNHHHGSYRHTIGDKVDTIGKALQVLIPSALLITGVSALFPNRVHVPTTPNKYRQKRSVFRRRVSDRGMVPPPQLARMPASHITPELEDIPSHILRAEHRIMDESSSELYPEYGQRYASSSESFGFNPFKVFKGPGPETTANNIQNSMPMLFPEIPNMPGLSEKSNEFMQNYQGSPPTMQSLPPNTLRPAPPMVEETPPTLSTPQVVIPQQMVSPPQRIIPQLPQVTTNLDTILQDPLRQRQNIQIRRRKPTRKPPVFLRETPKMPVQSSSESQNSKSQYLIKNTLEDSKQNNQEQAEQEFMSSLQNLVTPEIAKAIVENKQETPKNVDLSPDGPVMGLLTSYAQHENDSPACQKRALCELAVKGKQPKSTKFEAFLWSVATLVPDVFSEMYDLQEVFQSIREERCNSFACANPNLDLQAR